MNNVYKYCISHSVVPQYSCPIEHRHLDRNTDVGLEVWGGHLQDRGFRLMLNYAREDVEDHDRFSLQEVHSRPRTTEKMWNVEFRVFEGFLIGLA